MKIKSIQVFIKKLLFGPEGTLLTENDYLYMIKQMKSTIVSLQERGFISPEYAAQYESSTEKELIDLLNSPEPQKRTAAAGVLGRKKLDASIIPLCKALEREKKLYSKIAITEALAAIGEPAVPEVIKLLGKIGNNQYRSLPEKPFNKKSYPLPRDIAARTLIRIGKPAVPYLEEIISRGEAAQVSEALDAFGFISFYDKSPGSPGILFTCLEKYQSDDLIHWKVIRAFSAFPVPAVLAYLENLLKGTFKEQLGWEAERSISQLKTSL